ncbi:Pyridoxal phosphate-dependent transferase major region subdomain 1 [Penicillium canescens]|nr:Pyridoxal phosphate-dependent transferase major region subdomain 1 [Penicillium canescens]
MQPKTQIDLFQGWPATAMLPTQRLKQAANDVLSNKTIFNDGLAYGPDEGYYPLRKNIANWLSQSYTPLHTINAERISITGGASQNLACVLQVFTEPAQTQRIWLVEPCYHLVFRVFEDAGFAGRMVGIPEDEGGMDVTALELALSEFESSENHPPRIVDVDRELDGGPLDQFGNTVSNGSFSKLIGPGCRVGWAEGTEDFVYGLSQAGSTRSGGAPSQLMSTFINELLEDHFLPGYIADALIPLGRKRHRLLASAIKRYLGPLGVSFTPDPETSPVVGGYYIWVQLPVTVNATRVCHYALEEQNLVLGNGEVFAVPGRDSLGRDLHRRLRLCFMWEDEERLVEGVERLGAVIENLIDN